MTKGCDGGAAGGASEDTDARAGRSGGRDAGLTQNKRTWGASPDRLVGRENPVRPVGPSGRAGGEGSTRMVPRS